jgi:hypothetical protein
VTSYLARAVPWRALSVIGLFLVLLLSALSLRVARLWPLEGCAIGMLAGAAAWCFDEPTAEVVDTAPRTLAWRTAARSTGVGWLLAWWVFAVWIGRGSLHGHAVAVGLHGVAAAICVTAIVTWRREAGVPRPGTATAGMVTATAVFLALGRPYPRTIPLFPYVYGGPWNTAGVWWATMAAAGVGLMLLALSGLAGRGGRLRLGFDS